MAEETYKLYIEATDARAAGQGVRSLADDLRGVPGVLEVGRQKGAQPTMDLGAIVTVLASSGATLAIARGIADWIRRTRGTSLTIEKDPTSGSIKAEVHSIDPEAALRITEIVLGK